MKPSTLLITVVSITTDKITYTVQTDIVPREFAYLIPRHSQFPYEEIDEGGRYALVSVKVGEAWYWWLAYDLEASRCFADKSLNSVAVR